MPQLVRKRRAPAADAPSDSDDTPGPRSRTTQTQTQRRRPQRSPSPSTQPASDNSDNADPTTTSAHSTTSQSTKLLIRLALSSSLTRTPLRRSDINAKCGTTPSTFRSVFEDANLALRQTWGMQLTELPGREKVTVQERLRAAASQARGTGRGGGGGGGDAARNGGEGDGDAGEGAEGRRGGGGATAGGGTKQWILTSALPIEMREVVGRYMIGPSPTAGLEAAYTALTTFIVSLIMLSGGSLSEAKLERHLKRVNAEASTPVDSTEKTLARMVREGYVVKIREGGSGEDATVEFRVGPRGRVEVGEMGVGGVVREVYDVERMGEEARGDLEKRLEKSLKVAGPRAVGETQVANGVDGATASGGGAGSGRRRGRAAREDEDD